MFNNRNISCCLPKGQLEWFWFFNVDSVSQIGISGASFRLETTNGDVLNSISDCNGMVAFPIVACTTYTLTQVAPATGYIPITATYQVYMDSQGCLYIDNLCTPRLCIYSDAIAPFTFTKIDAATGLPLAGATFQLTSGGSVFTATSNAAGIVNFGPLALNSTYTLQEIEAPDGYLPNSSTYTVAVSSDGVTTIDGQPIVGYTISNTPATDLAFLKVDATTGLPLANAVFALAQGASIIDIVVSNDAGVVDFGIQPVGNYTMTEIVPPAGYGPNITVYSVVIDSSGGITINGIPLANFSVPNTAI